MELERAFWVGVSEGAILTSWRRRRGGKEWVVRKVRREGVGVVWGGLWFVVEVKNVVMGVWMKGVMPLMFQLKILREGEGVCVSVCFSVVVFAMRRRFSGGGDISRSIVGVCGTLSKPRI